MSLLTQQTWSCPNCGASVDGLRNRLPRERLRWYQSSTVRGCANCGVQLDYDAVSKRWILFSHLPLLILMLWPGEAPQVVWYCFILLALFGDFMFVRKRKIVAKR